MSKLPSFTQVSVCIVDTNPTGYGESPVERCVIITLTPEQLEKMRLRDGEYVSSISRIEQAKP